MNYVLGSKAQIGGVLGRGGAAAAAQWWLSGGVSAANAIAVYQPIGAASLATSYTNLANPGTYDAAPGVAPTFAAATGWTFNGSTQYLTTGVVPGSGWSAIVRFADAVTSNGYLFGAKGSNFWGILPQYSSNTLVLYVAGASTATGQAMAPQLSAGVLAIAGTRAYRNGVDDNLTLTNAAAPKSIWIGGANNTSLENPLSCKIQAIAIYNATLSAAQVAAISAAMAAL